MRKGQKGMGASLGEGPQGHQSIETHNCWSQGVKSPPKGEHGQLWSKYPQEGSYKKAEVAVLWAQQGEGRNRNSFIEWTLMLLERPISGNWSKGSMETGRRRLHLAPPRPSLGAGTGGASSQTTNIGQKRDPPDDAYWNKEMQKSHKN